MTKEQETIERLEYYLKNSAYKREDSDFFKNGGWEIVDLEIPKAIDTVLSMLKENSAKIEQKNTELAEKSAEIEKKDKEIDFILDKLNENYTDVFKNNEVKGIIEIYEKIKNTSNLSGIKLRKECIKQYFERKGNDD